METVPEKIFGYKILQESASQAKVPFEVGSFPVSLPGNLEMTANREKPEQLTFFFFEEERNLLIFLFFSFNSVKI